MVLDATSLKELFLINFHWLQVDCPEDVPSYIHRVGRTARYTASGRSLLFLTPSEETMLASLEAAKIPVKLIKVCLLHTHLILKSLFNIFWYL